MNLQNNYKTLTLFLFSLLFQIPLLAQVGVGTEAPKGADQLFNGKKGSLKKNWTYWEGPRIAAKLNIKWKLLKTLWIKVKR